MTKVFSVGTQASHCSISVELDILPGGAVITQDYLETLKLNGDAKTSLLGTATSIYDVGCFVGAIMAFSLGEILGRKKTVFLGTTVMAVGTVL